MTRGKRTRKATGIFQDAYGYAVVLKVNGQQKETRFTPDTNLDKLIAWRANQKVTRTGKATTDRRYTLKKAAADYLKTIPKGTPRHQNATSNLGAWLPAFGATLPDDLTSGLIRQQMATWRQKPSTTNHRRQELKNLYTFLNGKAGANPVRDVPRRPERYDDARGIAPELVEWILSHMELSATRLRLMVIWQTGLPHTQVAQLTRRHFNPVKKTLFATARRKGGGVASKTLPLTADAVTVLKALFAAKAEGPFSRSAMHKSFRLAVQTAKAAWLETHDDWPVPEDFHPYDLRHSRLTEAMRRSKNIHGVAELAMHAHISTTQRYVRAVASESSRSVVDAMESASFLVPAGGVKTRKNRRKRLPGAKAKKRRLSSEK